MLHIFGKPLGFNSVQCNRGADMNHSIPSGEGVNVAMHDALDLADQLAKHGPEEAECAVVEYEKLMFPRALATAEDAEGAKQLWEPDSPKSFLRSIGLA